MNDLKIVPMEFQGQTKRHFDMKDLKCDAEPYYNKEYFYFPELSHVSAERNKDIDGVTVPGGKAGRKWNVYIRDNVIDSEADGDERVQLCVLTSRLPDNAGYARTLIWMTDEDMEHARAMEGFEDYIILGEDDVHKLFMNVEPSTGQNALAE
ncbi:MAG: hypothetical protein ACLQQ4_06510 [Bacteroidia bacterium]